MSIFNPMTWFRSGNIETKVSGAGPVMVPFNVGTPVWTPRDYENLTKEAYVLNAVGFRCMKMISVCATAPTIMLKGRGGKEIEEHPLLDLLNRPSPHHSGDFLFESIYSYLLLAGNAYFEAVGPSRPGTPPLELWSLRPDRMKVVPGPLGVPAAYEYEVNGKKKRWPVSVRGESKILHVKEFHPLDDWYGLSRVEPGAYGVDRHNAASKHNKALIDNGARPGGALVFEPIKTPDGEGALNAPKEVIEQAEKELNARHGGPEKAGKPMVLGGNVNWLEMGLTPKDMDFDESKQDAARDICNAWGVPHILIVRGQSTYNNVREAKLELYEDTVLPLMEHVFGELNNWLTPMFGDELKLEPDLDSISALEPRREVTRKTYSELMDKGVVDADEARDALGYGPRDPKAVRKVDAAVLKALVESVETIGPTPLRRYLVSVGLITPDVTEEDLLEAALSLLEDDGDDAASEEGDDNDIQE